MTACSASKLCGGTLLWSIQQYLHLVCEGSLQVVIRKMTSVMVRLLFDDMYANRSTHFRMQFHFNLVVAKRAKRLFQIDSAAAGVHVMFFLQIFPNLLPRDRPE